MKAQPFLLAASFAALFVSVVPTSAGAASQGFRDFAFGPRAHQSTDSNPITPEPPIKRPNTTKCVVTLISDYPFDNFTPATGAYAPPAASQCPGPWSKVVLDWTVSVSGIQYDRLGAIWLGQTEIFHFTTSEPPGSQITWHVEKDVTEYANTLETANDYTVSLGNIVNSSLTGVYNATATLTFYEPGPKWPAATTADVVDTVASTGSPPWFTLNGPSNQASSTLSLPTNIQSARLEVYTTGHNCDEFWYANESTAYAQSVGSTCGGTAYREIDVYVDSMLASVIVPFPYIYTGGIDPGFWIPIPGHDTLNIPPYEVDLSPFVGILTNGQQHTIAFDIDNNSNYWVGDADLFLTLDHGSSTTSGALVRLKTSPKVVEHYNESHLNSAGGKAWYRADHALLAEGYVDTSKGRIRTTVTQDWSFFDRQNFANSGSYYIYDASTLGTTKETVVGGGQTHTTTTNVAYPLQVRKPAGQSLEINQAWYQTVATSTKHSDESAESEDVIRASAKGGVHTSEHYVLQDTTGYCYDQLFTAKAGVLTGNTGGNCSNK